MHSFHTLELFIMTTIVFVKKITDIFLYRKQSGKCCVDYDIFIRIINRNPMLNLCDRENRHEQSVNSQKNHVQNIKFLGRYIEGFIALVHISSYISLPIKNAYR